MSSPFRRSAAGKMGLLTGNIVQLLLFLSALLAGLTGAFAGDRDVRVVQQAGTAITRAAEAVAEVAVAQPETRIALPPVAGAFVALANFAVYAAPVLRPARLTSERRLE